MQVNLKLVFFIVINNIQISDLLNESTKNHSILQIDHQIGHNNVRINLCCVSLTAN